jgi:lysophospholipase L1-like esterase
VTLPLRSHHLRALLLLCLAFSIQLSPAQQPDPAPATPQTQPAPTISSEIAAAITPTDRLNLPWWSERHTRIVDAVRAHTDAQLLLIGDSITQNYEKANPPDQDFLPIWRQFYEPRRALNLGFSGDGTANVLWRLTHGEIDGLNPRVAVILVGTNNTGWIKQTAEQTEAGIDNIIGLLSQRLPQTRLLLLSILPSDVSPEKTAADEAINKYLSVRYGKNTGLNAHIGPNADPRVTYLDLTSTFMADGKINPAIYYDPRLPAHGKSVHPDTTGQRKMAEAIEPTLAKLMGDKPRTTPQP